MIPGKHEIEIINAYTPLSSKNGSMVGGKYTRTKRGATIISKEHNVAILDVEDGPAEGFAEEFSVAIINGEYFSLTPMKIEFNDIVDAKAAEIEKILARLSEHERALLGVQ